MCAQFVKFYSKLPDYLTSFIGREREIAQVKRLLTQGAGANLVTLTGVGGSGKTRLAAELVRSLVNGTVGENPVPFVDGVCWVNLSGLSDPALLPQTVATALGLREAAGRSPTAAMLVALRQAHLLLVLDNCEQIIDACGALVQQLLSNCSQLVILATSRIPLKLAGEAVFQVPSLKTVEVGHGAAGVYLAEGEAVKLFLDRAAMMLSGYTIQSQNALTINQICRQLDGLPLAIELAASWIRVLSTQDILMQVQESLDILASTEPTLAPRHRSMRAVLDTSWQRLTTEQQRVFASLAVFRGGFSREAAEVVAMASLPSLAALVEHSLIRRLVGGRGSTRYQLHELVRQYAQDRLKAFADGSSEQARHRYLAFFLALAEQAAQAWDTAEETVWLDRLKDEHDNLREALHWAINMDRSEEALRLSSALFTFWVYSTPPDAYRELLQQALDLKMDGESAAVNLARAKTANLAGYTAVATSDNPQALAFFQEGLALYTDAGDARGIAWSLRGCGFATMLGGDAKGAQPFVEQSLTLCRQGGETWGEAWSIFDLGHIAFAQGAIERAQPLLEDSLLRFRALGILFGAYRALILLGDIQRRQSCWAEAITNYVAALELEQKNRFGQFGADLLEGVAKIAALQRQPERTALLFGAGDAWRQIFGQARSFFYDPGYQSILAITRAQLAEDDWLTAYKTGFALTSEQAMSEARQVTQTLVSTPFTPYPSGLTEREVEVLRLLVEGLKNQEIADKLVVSPRTIHAHLRSIYSKLAVNTRTAAAYKAAQLKLV